MEDMQNQTAGEHAPRRRRAVRSVRMGSPGGTVNTTPSASAETAACPTEPAVYAAPAVGHAAEQIPAAPAEPAQTLEDALAEALNGALRDAQKESPAETVPDPSDEAAAVPLTAPVFLPQTEEVAEDAEMPRQSSLFENTEEFHAGGQENPGAGQGRSALTAAVIAAALLLVCMVIVLPLLRTAEAVMLYVDETAVGYIADAGDADRQAELLLGDLAGDDLSFDAEALYRCEAAEVRGAISTLSDGAIYDALFAEATEGYVRAYRLIPTEPGTTPVLSSGDNGIGEMLGVMTEAEILSAIDAAEAICRQRYTANLPAGTEISVEPCFAWDTAWIAEHALLDEGALVAWLTDEQTIASGLLSVTAELTETEAERIPYETTLIPNDENFDGIRTMISAGADGLAQVSYTVSMNPVTGEVICRTESERTVVREPVSAVSYEGLYPLPDGVSTGTFDWPLPPLPDDELPLDENGNPYVPENTLALKNTYVSSGYGERLLWGAYDFHLGLDIVAPAYTEIYAADGGVVVYAAYTSSYGYMTRIRHADNVETVYAHQYKQAVKAGDVVEKGQLIGYVGSTGTSSGNHLHLEFRRDHVTVDPSEYITIPEDILVLGE